VHQLNCKIPRNHKYLDFTGETELRFTRYISKAKSRKIWICKLQKNSSWNYSLSKCCTNVFGLNLSTLRFKQLLYYYIPKCRAYPVFRLLPCCHSLTACCFFSYIKSSIRSNSIQSCKCFDKADRLIASIWTATFFKCIERFWICRFEPFDKVAFCLNASCCFSVKSVK